MLLLALQLWTMLLIERSTRYYAIYICPSDHFSYIRISGTIKIMVNFINIISTI
jgi:hypothetical protein